MDLTRHFENARNSAFSLRLLNHMLWRGIPFNKPHRLRITKLEKEGVEVLIPYRRKNRNHIQGLHACVLATGAEYASGLLLLQQLDPTKYRLIMKKLEVEYHYQGKEDALVSFPLSLHEVEQQILRPLETTEAVVHVCQVLVHDKTGNLLCTANVHWQIKPWSKVRTRT